MEHRSIIERLARHLAAHDPDHWQAKVEDAASILAILKDPDEEMREAGDERVWRTMVDAALRDRWSIPPSDQGVEPPCGTDEEGEFDLPPSGVSSDRAKWVHVHDSQEKSG